MDRYNNWIQCAKSLYNKPNYSDQMCFLWQVNKESFVLASQPAQCLFSKVGVNLLISMIFSHFNILRGVRASLSILLMGLLEDSKTRLQYRGYQPTLLGKP